MERWTIQQLKEISDMAFINAILQERANGLTNPYSPLSQKISEVQARLKTDSMFNFRGYLEHVKRL